MNLKPELLQTMLNLGVNQEELAMLMDKMMSAVVSRQAAITALDAQIATLTSQREAVFAELQQANVTVGKLVSSE